MKTNLLKKIVMLSLAVTAAAPLCAMECGAAVEAGLPRHSSSRATAGAAEAAGYKNNHLDTFRARCAAGLFDVNDAVADAARAMLFTLQERALFLVHPEDLKRLPKTVTLGIFQSLEEKLKGYYRMYACNTPQALLFAMAERGTRVGASIVREPAVVVRLTVLAGADLNARDLWGRTPLYLAARYGNADVMWALLVVSGIDVKAHDSNSMTPLHVAAGYANADVVRRLLAAGAVVNVQDYWGLTPLHCAAWRGDADVVQALLNAGADMSIQNCMGLTPLQIAAQRGHAAVVGLLRQHAGGAAGAAAAAAD